MRKVVIFLLWLGMMAFTGCREQAAVTRSANPDEALPIVHLQTRYEVMTVLAGPDGPVYTVRTRDGRMLGERLSEQELRAQLPHLHHLLKSSYADGEPGRAIWADTLTPGPEE
jgi:hypothetical protein